MNLRKIISLGILGIFCWHFCLGQMSKMDSIRTFLYEIPTDSSRIDFLMNESWTYARTNPELSMQLLREWEMIGMEKNLTYKQDVLYYYFGVIHKNLGDYQESERYFNKYYEYHRKKENQANLAIVAMTKANLFSDQGLWHQSMNSVTESLRLYDNLDDTLGTIRASSKLGYILGQLDRYRDGLSYHEKSLELAKIINDSTEQAIAYSNIGLVYENLGLLDSALYFFHLGQKLDEIAKDKWGLVYDKTQMARVFSKKEDFESALPLAQEAHQYALDLKAPSLIVYSQLQLAHIFTKTGFEQKGIKLLKEIIENEKYNQSLQDQGEAHEALYEAYKSLSKPVLALKHLEQHHLLQDSILNQEITSQINDLEIRYQTQKKEQEIALLNSQKVASDYKLKSSRRQLVGLGSVLLIFAGLLMWLFQLNRKIQSQNAIISKALEEKSILLKEIHHRVKNNLQVVSSLLNLQSRHVEDISARKALKEGQNRVKSMGLIHQKLYQEDNLTGIEVKEYVEKLTQSLFHSYNISPDKIQLKLDIDNLNLDVDTLIPMGLIINELVSNALKHAFDEHMDGIVRVVLKENQNQLELEVSDNGKGLDHQENDALKRSFGYRLITAFSNQLKAKLEVNGNDGTRVGMYIRNYKKVA
jgi:two-component sensor histidine kinase